MASVWRAPGHKPRARCCRKIDLRSAFSVNDCVRDCAGGPQCGSPSLCHHRGPTALCSAAIIADGGLAFSTGQPAPGACRRFPTSATAAGASALPLWRGRDRSPGNGRRRSESSALNNSVPPDGEHKRRLIGAGYYCNARGLERSGKRFGTDRKSKVLKNPRFPTARPSQHADHVEVFSAQTPLPDGARVSYRLCLRTTRPGATAETTDPDEADRRRF